jgi:Mn2+/Fe2+ NRAMP family transporter
VLAGSAAYGIGESLHWDVSLEKRPADAKKFYSAIVICTLMGLLLNFMSLDPMKTLFWAAVLNGLAAVPLMIVIMLMATSPKVMGTFVLPRYLRLVGWLAAIVMCAVCAGLVLVARG